MRTQQGRQGLAEIAGGDALQTKPRQRLLDRLRLAQIPRQDAGREGDPVLTRPAVADARDICGDRTDPGRDFALGHMSVSHQPGPAAALLHKSANGQSSPFPGHAYPMVTVTGMPRAVKRFGNERQAPLVRAQPRTRGSGPPPPGGRRRGIEPPSVRADAERTSAAGRAASRSSFSFPPRCGGGIRSSSARVSGPSAMTPSGSRCVPGLRRCPASGAWRCGGAE